MAIVAECADGAAAREAIASVPAELALLDVRMPVESGLDVALARERSGGPFIVFVTAYDRFALPAFQADAVDYLTKPLTEERFDAMLERVRERMRLRQLAAAADPRTAAFVDHLVSRVGNRDVIIPLDDVDYIEADDVYAAVVSGGRRHLVRTALDALERSLDPDAFARIHRSYIVRLDRVREVRRANGSELVLADGTILPVSRRRRTAIEGLIKPFAT